MNDSGEWLGPLGERGLWYWPPRPEPVARPVWPQHPAPVAGACRPAWLALPGAMSEASSADVGAAHANVVPGGVKRDGPLLPAPVRRRRLRGKTSPEELVGNDFPHFSQSQGDADDFGSRAASDDPDADDLDADDPDADDSAGYRVAFARYKRWALKDIVSSLPKPQKRIYESERGTAFVAEVWKTRYKPGGDSFEWLQQLDRWKQSRPPRPMWRPGIDDLTKDAALLSAGATKRRRECGVGDAKRLNSAFCTYNGEWGRLTDWTVSERLLDEVQVLRQDMTVQERQAIAVTTMCDELRTQSAQLAQLWRRLQNSLPDRLEALSIFQWACSLELSPQTFLESRVLRVHLHVFVHFGSRKRDLNAVSSQLRIFGSQPIISVNHLGHVAQSRTVGPNAGMYYLQCPKIGMLHNMGSVQPFTGYLVNGEWIMNMVQQQKMLASKARPEIVRTAKRLPAMLENLDRWVRETRSTHLRQLEAALRRDLSTKAQPFKTLEPVVQWLKQFDKKQERYKFLVLDGLSGMGKTQFAHSLASAPGAVLDINMASAPEPDLREYKPGIHEVILMDEMTPEKVLSQKKLFQAGPSEIGLAASATSCHAYKVWVWRRRFVCCSNIWRQRLARLCAEDRDWINANSVLVVVTEPLWVTQAQPSDPGSQSPLALPLQEAAGGA